MAEFYDCKAGDIVHTRDGASYVMVTLASRTPYTITVYDRATSKFKEVNINQVDSEKSGLENAFEAIQYLQEDSWSDRKITNIESGCTYIIDNIDRAVFIDKILIEKEPYETKEFTLHHDTPVTYRYVYGYNARVDLTGAKVFKLGKDIDILKIIMTGVDV